MCMNGIGRTGRCTAAGRWGTKEGGGEKVRKGMPRSRQRLHETELGIQAGAQLQGGGLGGKGQRIKRKQRVCCVYLHKLYWEFGIEAAKGKMVLANRMGARMIIWRTLPMLTLTAAIKGACGQPLTRPSPFRAHPHASQVLPCFPLPYALPLLPTSNTQNASSCSLPLREIPPTPLSYSEEVMPGGQPGRRPGRGTGLAWLG